MTEDRGALCIVLHSHMPYVEGFGTWPFGEEWLWEAVATVYLPLLELCREAPVTIGLTPVLCDQFEAMCGDAGRRFAEFMRGTRAQIHAEDSEGLERTGHPELAEEIRRAATDYVHAEAQFERHGGDLVGAFAALCEQGPGELWTGPATHALLPLLATTAGLHMQLASGSSSHTRRFGHPARGLWLPECAYEPGLERDLADHGVQAFCVDQTGSLGLGSLDQLEPIQTEAGPVAVPIDWLSIELIWNERTGYPTASAYRNSHQRTTYDLKPWDNAGRPYDYAAAIELAQRHARGFVAHSIVRLDSYRSERGRRGLLCCALDSELLGHWWYEGTHWLEAVVQESERQGLELASVSAALAETEAVARPLVPSSWGTPKDLSTWDSPPVAELAFALREAELRTVAATAELARTSGSERSRRRAICERAARELLALQASDWAFLVSRATAADYPELRAAGHRASLDAALVALADSDHDAVDPELRHLAPDLDLSPLIAP